MEKSSIIFLDVPFHTEHIQVIEKGNTDRLLGPVRSKCTKEQLTRSGSRNSKIDVQSGPPPHCQLFTESTLEFTVLFHSYSVEELKRIKKAYWGAVYRKEK
jgi:hypothetical protein